jgi:predicted nucleotidyltransferase
MKATEIDRKRLHTEVQRLLEQLKTLGADKVLLFGSLAKNVVSLFSDIDLVVVFDDPRSPRELTRWVYTNVDSNEAVDILAYNREALKRLGSRPFLQRVLKEGKVLYERSRS